MKILPRIAIHRPDDPAVVHERLQEGCLPLAGGTELLLAAREGLLPGVELVDIRLANGEESGFRTWEVQPGRIEIGALLTHSEIVSRARRSADQASQPAVREFLRALAALVNAIGNIRVRNQGTLGGNLAFGEPRSDWTGSLVALGAEVRLHDGEQWRQVPLRELLVDAFYVDRQPAELMTSVVLDTRGLAAFRYRRWSTGERPLANVTGGAWFSEDGAPTYSVVVGACTPVPVRVVLDRDALSALRPAELADGLELFDVSRRGERAVRNGVARLIELVRDELLYSESA